MKDASTPAASSILDRAVSCAALTIQTSLAVVAGIMLSADVQIRQKVTLK